MADNKENKVLNVPALRFSELTEEWKDTTLDNECTINPTSDKLKAEFVYIDLESVEKGELTKKQVIEKASAPSRAQRVLQNGDVLFQCVRPYQKNNYLVKDVSPEIQWVASTGYAQLRTKKNNPAFIYHLLNTSSFNKKVIVRCTGSSYPAINSDDLSKIHFYICGIEEQKRIADFLSLLDERIATQNKIIEDLKKLKSAIVEMILCKQGGVLLKLGDVGSFIRGLTYSSEDIAEDINATTVIRANNLNYGNNVSKKDVVYVNKKPTEIQILRKGDIVICMANGSSSLVGKNSYYSFDDRQSTIGAFCGIYRSSQPLVKWLMQSQRYRRLVYQSLQGGNGAIANLNGDDILNMTFYVVEDKKSVSILSALVLIENSIAVNEKLQELYSMQKEYLLQHLFI